jgi:hypothetical protein
MVSPVLFIGGTSYCGSTLLSMLLNAHPDLVSVGELTGPVFGSRLPIGEYLCSCGETLTECPLWQTVSQLTRDHGVEFSPDQWDLFYTFGSSRLSQFVFSRSLRTDLLDGLRDRLRDLSPGLRRRLEELRRRNAVVIAALLEAASSRYLVDASKDPARIRYLQATPGLDVSVLHLVRDPLGYVASDLRHHPKRSLRDATHAWLRTAQYMKRIEATTPPEKFMRVRYEDLCANQPGTLGRITDFLGVPSFVVPPAFRETNHHVIGNPMRKESGASISLDERWKHDLQPNQISWVSSKTQSDRARFGYHPDNTGPDSQNPPTR